MIATARDRRIVITVAAAWVLIVAFAGGALTDVGPWYESLKFPSWRPPNWLFGPAWTIIFILIATSGVLAWFAARDPNTRRILIVALAVNSVLNVLWSALFFKMRRPDWALVEVALLWLSILVLVIVTGRINTRAGWLMAPYLAWVSFAAFLNWTMVRLNAPSERHDAKRSAGVMAEAWLHAGVIDWIIGLVAIEAVALLGWRAVTGRGPAPISLVANLASGAFLLLAMRNALRDAPFASIGGCLFAALVAHAIDLATRWTASSRNDETADHRRASVPPGSRVVAPVSSDEGSHV